MPCVVSPWRVTSSDEATTRALAVEYVRRLPFGTVLALHGPMGAGKTTFVRGLAEALAPGARVASPTFAYLHLYGEPPVMAHFDLYRLQDPATFLLMGWEEECHDLALTVIEWPERLGAFCPPTARHLYITPYGSERVLEEAVDG